VWQEKIGQNEAKLEKDRENQSKGMPKNFFANVPVKRYEYAFK